MLFSVFVFPKSQINCVGLTAGVNQHAPGLTVGQRSDRHVLGRDAGAVLVVGHHTETVLGVLLQAVQSVRLAVRVDVLEGQKKMATL